MYTMRACFVLAIVGLLSCIGTVAAQQYEWRDVGLRLPPIVCPYIGIRLEFVNCVNTADNQPASRASCGGLPMAPVDEYPLGIKLLYQATGPENGYAAYAVECTGGVRGETTWFTTMGECAIDCRSSLGAQCLSAVPYSPLVGSSVHVLDANCTASKPTYTPAYCFDGNCTACTTYECAVALHASSTGGGGIHTNISSSTGTQSLDVESESSLTSKVRDFIVSDAGIITSAAAGGVVLLGLVAFLVYRYKFPTGLTSNMYTRGIATPV